MVEWIVPDTSGKFSRDATRMRPAEPSVGKLLARGVRQLLRQFDFVAMDEISPCRGLRVDVMAVGPKGEIWIVECKSTIADFTSDHKWTGYLEYCDRFFWAVDPVFPAQLLPSNEGLIIADGFDAEIARWGDEHVLRAARRKMLLIKFARTAVLRFQRESAESPYGSGNRS